MNDDAGRDEHEPPARQLVPPARQHRQAAGGDGDADGAEDPGATGERRDGEDQRRRRQQPRGDAGERGSRSAGAGRTAPRRRRPTPGCRRGRTPLRDQRAGGDGGGEQGDRLRRGRRRRASATAATTSEPGTVALASVSVDTLGIAKRDGADAHPAHAASVPATCTARGMVAREPRRSPRRRRSPRPARPRGRATRRCERLRASGRLYGRASRQHHGRLQPPGRDRTDCGAVVTTTVPCTRRLAVRAPGASPAAGVPRLATLRPGTATGVGSLPHRSADAAARFALTEYDLPAIPSLPAALPGRGHDRPGGRRHQRRDGGAVRQHRRRHRRRRPGGPGAHRRRHRQLLADCAGSSTTPSPPASTRPVKWQFVGPVTLGVALTRAGLADDVAFAVAARAVRSHVVVPVGGGGGGAAAFPADPHHRRAVVRRTVQPRVPDRSRPGDRSAVRGDGERRRGRHRRRALLWRRRPGVVARRRTRRPVDPGAADLAGAAGYLGRFLDGGGRVAWGVVATDGPMFGRPDRHWRELVELWAGARAARRRRRRCCGGAASSRRTAASGCTPRSSPSGCAGRSARSADASPPAACEDQHRMSDAESEADDRGGHGWSPSPNSSATTTAATTSSTIRRSPTATSTPSCASCATSPAANPDVEFDNPLEGDVGGSPSAAVRAGQPRRADDEPRQRDDSRGARGVGDRGSPGACPTRR